MDFMKYDIRCLYRKLCSNFDIRNIQIHFHSRVLCKECVCVLYGLQHSSLVLGTLRQFLMDLVAIKCDFDDWLGVMVM